MSVNLLSIDLGKRSFHVYGIDTEGVILSRKVSRTKLDAVVDALAPRAIAMEVCASAHYWARSWLACRRYSSPHRRCIRHCAGYPLSQ